MGLICKVNKLNAAIHGFGESVKRVVCKACKHTPAKAPEHQSTKEQQRPVRELYKAKTRHCETGSVQTPFSEPVSAFAASNSPNAPSFTCLSRIFNPPPFPWCLCIRPTVAHALSLSPHLWPLIHSPPVSLCNRKPFYSFSHHSCTPATSKGRIF